MNGLFALFFGENEKVKKKTLQHLAAVAVVRSSPPHKSAFTFVLLFQIQKTINVKIN